MLVLVAPSVERPPPRTPLNCPVVDEPNSPVVDVLPAPNIEFVFCCPKTVGLKPPNVLVPKLVAVDVFKPVDAPNGDVV